MRARFLGALRAASLLGLLFGALHLTACLKEENPLYCEGHPNDPICIGKPGICGRDQDCESPRPVCDIAGIKTCVQCVSAKAMACMGTTPVCGANDQCRGCKSDAECVSNDCDTGTGSCVESSARPATDPAAGPAGVVARDIDGTVGAEPAEMGTYEAKP